MPPCKPRRGHSAKGPGARRQTKLGWWPQRGLATTRLAPWQGNPKEGPALQAATRVGDESASQFSREYHRLFGMPPGKDNGPNLR